MIASSPFHVSRPTARGSLLVAGVVLLSVCVAMGSPLQDKEPSLSQTASGTFEVNLKPEAQSEETGIGRMSLSKTFLGQFEGTSSGTMLASHGNPQTSAVYVAIERLEGRLEGRSGSFILAHKGTMTAHEQSVSITIAPDSGTDELEGISGTCEIEIDQGAHRYKIEYSLPE